MAVSLGAVRLRVVTYDLFICYIRLYPFTAFAFRLKFIGHKNNLSEMLIRQRFSLIKFFL